MIKQDCDFNILIISENQKFKYELMSKQIVFIF